MLEHTHPSGAFTITLPAEWDVYFDVDGLVMVAVDPEDEYQFHPNIVVTADEVPHGTQLTEWFEQLAELVSGALVDAVIVESERCEVSGHVAQRQLVHHNHNGQIVALDQWAIPVGPVAWYFSASAAVESRERMADTFRRAVESVRINPGELA